MSMLAAVIQANLDLAADVIEMDAFSWAFMLTCMTAVCSLTFWCFNKVLRGKAHFDPDGTGPAHAPVPGSVELED